MFPTVCRTNFARFKSVENRIYIFCFRAVEMEYTAFFLYLGDYNIVMKAIIMLYFRRAPANNEKRKIA